MQGVSWSRKGIKSIRISFM